MKKKIFTRKRIIRGSILLVLLVLFFPIFIISNRIYNDAPLREYVQEKIIDQSKDDMGLYSSSNKTADAKLNVLNLNISKKELSNLNKQVDRRLASLEKDGVPVMGTSNWEYVKASLKVKNKKFTIELKIRGDMPSNYNRGIEKATLRMNIKGAAFQGKKKLSIIRPQLESGYYGYLFYKTFKDEKFLANHIEIVQLYINGEYVGLRFLQEGFSKELLESADHREGPIVRFKDDCTDCHHRYNEHLFPEMIAHQEKKTLKSEGLSKNYNRALNKYEALRSGQITVDQCLNIDKFAKYMALSDIFLAHHAFKCQNIKMYYNPIDDHFEPIAWDPNNYDRYQIKLDVDKGHTERFGELCNMQKQYPLHFLLSQNEEFLKKYAKYLKAYAHNKSMMKMINKYAGIINNTKVELFRQNFQERFDPNKFLYNLKTIQTDFAQEDLIYASYYRNDSILKVHVNSNLPIKIDSIKYKDQSKRIGRILAPNSTTDLDLEILTKELSKKKVKVFCHTVYSKVKSTYSAKVFSDEEEIGGTFFNEKFDRSLFVIDKSNKTIKLKNKAITVSSNLYIPDLGYTWIIEPGSVIMLHNAFVISECTVISKGTKKDPIYFNSDHTGGLLVKNAYSESKLTYTNFSNLTSPHEGNWNTTGAVTFYRSDVNINHCMFANNLSEDALNIVNSKFEISNSKILGAASDALDIDFCTGKINSIEVIDPKNDALDFSGSNITILSAKLSGAGDKALSAGERTSINAQNISITNSFIGVAAKDSSNIKLKNSSINNCEYTFTVYQKKAEYDKAKITVSGSKISGSKYLLENGCKLFIDKKKKKTNSSDVYNFLYQLE